MRLGQLRHSFFGFLFFVSLGLIAQEKQSYTFSNNSLALVDLILEFKSQSQVPVIFSPNKISKEQVILPDNPISKVRLFQFFEDTGLTVLDKGNRVLIGPGKIAKPEKFTIFGYARDRGTGEVLIGANVFIPEIESGVVTNKYGYYSMTLPAGDYTLQTTFIGYESNTSSLQLSQTKKVDFALAESSLELEEITISSRPPSYNVQSLIPGINTLDFSTDRNIPYFMGEVDVFQGALLLPGIKILGEEASGLNVRGGGIDENLILLDEAPIYNPNHYFGLISVFNPEAVNDIQFFKGFFPAKYGGRASSVITVHQREGNDQSFKFSGGLGLLSARIVAEGPIEKQKSSFLISARQSLLNPTELGNPDTENQSETFFTDLNLKANWKRNNSSYFVSGYIGNDRNITGFDATRRWGNRTLTFRWNRQYRQRFFSHFSAIFSEYNYRIEEPREAGSFIGKFRVIDYALKLDQSFYVTPESQINFGASTTFHRLRPGERLPFDPDDTSTNPLRLDSEHGLESGMYLSHEWSINKFLSVYYGLRFSSLLNIGPATVFRYSPDSPKTENTRVDTLQFNSGESIEEFYNFEPRITINFSPKENVAIKAAYNRTFQYIHLISNTITPNPTDIWKLSDSHIAPTRTDHFSLGLFKNFSDNQWESYVDFFFKDIRNSIDYKDGADLLFNPYIETELLNADARAYGMEVFIKKNVGQTQGWLSYTLSRAERRTTTPFPEEQINDGNYFPDDNDKTHDLSFVMLQRLTQRVELSASFNYSTGRPITLPTGKYNFEGNPIPHFSNRNQNRITDYHRLDLSFKLNGRRVKKNGQVRKFQDYWTFTVYNVYARRNAFSYFFRESDSQPGETEVVRYSVFGTAIPSLTYNFNF